MSWTCFRAIINLQIFFRFFDIILFLSSDLMVLTNVGNMCKKIPKACFRVIENLQIFLEISCVLVICVICVRKSPEPERSPERSPDRVIKNLKIFFWVISVKSFLSTDFMVLTNIFKFSADFAVFYHFSGEISCSPLICVKNPQNLG